MINERHPVLLSFAPLIDGLLIAFSGWVAYKIRWDSWAMAQEYLFTLMLGTALAVVLLPISGAYHSWRGRVQWHDTGYALPGLVLVAVILTVLGTITKTSADFSRLWMGYWFVLSLTALFVFRGLSGKLQSKRSQRKRKVLILGDGELALSVARALGDTPEAGLEVIGFLSISTKSAVGNLPGPVLGSLAELESVVAREHFDELWIAAGDLDTNQRLAIVQMLEKSFMTVRFVPDLSMLALLNHIPSEIAGMTVINLNASPLDGHNALLKSAFDKLFSALALVLLCPLFCLLAIAIKLDSRGPVFFRQRRHGWDGKIIHILKFRTMYLDESLADVGRQAVRADPRVTRVGRLLRRTSLDELPQFINVLLGDMSVVGPRPHPVTLNENYVGRIDAFMQRHRVKPGITGWAQVHGLRGETETLEKMQRRIDYDLYYIENWSLWLDVKIILRTLLGGWMGESAY
jgi:putative colanic acid biosynthesis UDP-glucose lipid carrier transferase